MWRAYRRMDGVREKALRLPVDQNARVVMMSDLHRGVGNNADNFARNQNLFHVALSHYDREGFTYIELGDGDELWENKGFPRIAAEYDHIFARMSKLYREGRLYLIAGNHDRVKEREKWVRNNLSSCPDHHATCLAPLFPDIRVWEGILLEERGSGREILLLHGHQADFFNDGLGWLSMLLVRHVWSKLELVGVRNPLNSSANPVRRDKVERLLAGWSRRRDHMLVAGHTHRPVFPGPGEPLYFNDGSGVHPRYITALELDRGRLALVKWGVATRRDGVLYVAREVLSGPRGLEEYPGGQGNG